MTKLVIPIPPLEKQKEIADKYKTVKDEITMLQLKLEKAKNRMAHIIEEGEKLLMEKSPYNLKKF